MIPSVCHTGELFTRLLGVLDPIMTMQEPYKPIDCNLYDYLEIACLHRYEVELRLRDGSVLQGVAHTTKTRADGEYLLLQLESATLELRLDQIAHLEVRTEPRSFDSVSFY